MFYFIPTNISSIPHSSSFQDQRVHNLDRIVVCISGHIITKPAAAKPIRKSQNLRGFREHELSMASKPFISLRPNELAGGRTRIIVK